MKKETNYLTLLTEFAKFGCFTFGGGLSIISQMQQLYVEKKKTITAEELVDLTSVAKSLPGAMIGNVGMLYGYREGGILGGFICVAGMCIPPMLILILISLGYASFRENYWVSAAMEGIQAAVPAIVATACFGLVKGSIKDWVGVVITAAAVVLYLVFQINVLYLIVLGVICGLILGEVRERKEAGNHGAA